MVDQTKMLSAKLELVLDSIKRLKSSVDDNLNQGIIDAKCHDEAMHVLNEQEAITEQRIRDIQNIIANDTIEVK